MSSDMVAFLLIKFKPLTRVIIVLCGAVIIHLTIGTYHTYGNMLPYIASYMRNYTDPTISLEQLVWVPNFQGCFPFAMVIGGMLSTVFGPRIAAFFGCAIMTTGVFLTSWTIKISLGTFLLTYGVMFGFGQGIAYVTALNTAINWAPNNVGITSGIVAAGFGLSSSIFAPIQTLIINPENDKPTTSGYFTDKDLILRVPSVFGYLAIIYGIMQFIGLIVMCDPPDAALQSKELEKQITAIDFRCFYCADWFFHGRRRPKDSFAKYCYEKLPKIFEDEYELQTDDEPVQTHQANSRAIGSEETEFSISTSLMLRSSTFYCLFAALFGCSFYGNMYYNLYKTYGETFIDDDLFMAYAFSTASVINAFSRIFWGFLADHTNFQTATSLATFFLLTMPLMPSCGKWPYFVWLNAMFVCLAATHAFFITASVKCFGSKNKSVNYGFLILSTTFSAFVLSLYCQYLLPVLGYKISFFITAGTSLSVYGIISLINKTPQGYRIA